MHYILFGNENFQTGAIFSARYKNSNAEHKPAKNRAKILHLYPIYKKIASHLQ